jgi:hypothetical protein
MSEPPEPCNWCGAPQGKILEKEIPLEIMMHKPDQTIELLLRKK